jgi:hypothetical protein
LTCSVIGDDLVTVFKIRWKLFLDILDMLDSALFENHRGRDTLGSGTQPDHAHARKLPFSLDSTFRICFCTTRSPHTNLTNVAGHHPYSSTCRPKRESSSFPLYGNLFESSSHIVSAQPYEHQWVRKIETMILHGKYLRYSVSILGTLACEIFSSLDKFRAKIHHVRFIRVLIFSIAVSVRMMREQRAWLDIYIKWTSLHSSCFHRIQTKFFTWLAKDFGMTIIVLPFTKIMFCNSFPFII